MSEELEITIAKDGAMTIEAKGHKGAGCLTELDTLLRDIERDGVKAGSKDTKKKQEYYATAERQTIQAKH